MPAHTDSTPAPKTTSSNKPSTKRRTKTRIPRPRYYTAFKQRSDNDEEDGYTSSEEEIISELDEAALSKLPLHLQANMRDLQAERIHRLKTERGLRKLRYLHRYREHKSPESKDEQKANSTPQREDKDPGAEYAEKWFQKTLAKVAAAREIEVNKVMENYDDDICGHHENMTWCPVRHEWVPVYYGQDPGHEHRQAERMPTNDNGVRDRVNSGASRLCGAGIAGQDETRLSQADTVVAERYYLTSGHDCRMSSHSRYLSWRCAGPYYVYEARTGQDHGQPEERRGRLSSFLSDMRSRIQVKLRRAKNMFK